jgi:ATP-dependent Clp endopeptidase proteolytic subunit ClpP
MAMAHPINVKIPTGLLARAPRAAAAKAQAKRLDVKNADGDVAEIFIYDEIGYWGVEAKDFIRDLASVSAPKVKVRINSPGGSVFDGLAIYNAIASYPGEIECHVDGLAASAASFIALAGDKVVMAENSMLMIHNAWGVAIGNKADMRQIADVLEKIDAQLNGMYVAKTGKDAAEIQQMLDDETWLTAAEAKEMGFVDEVTGASDAKATVRDGLYAKTPASLLANNSATPENPPAGHDAPGGEGERTSTDEDASSDQNPAEDAANKTNMEQMRAHMARLLRLAEAD